MDYQLGNIYKIICTVNSDFIYIGSTFRKLNLRWNAHKSKYKKYLQNGISTMSTHKFYDKYGIQSFRIVLIKSYKVSIDSNWDNKELKVFEQLWLNKTKNAVNSISAFNPLRKLDKNIWNKKYRKNNKEEINAQKKEYWHTNKEKLNKKRKEKITCDCGSIIRKGNLSKHIKSKKHAKLMQDVNTLKII